MQSKARIFGEALHPMLNAFPVAFYTATAVSFVTYQSNGDPFWFRMAFCANIAGLVMAALAAIPGLMDYNMVIPKYSSARTTGLTHMTFNILAFVFFGINAVQQSGKWYEVQPEATSAIYLSVLGLACTMMAGFFGWKLVQKHHIGVDDSLIIEQRRNDMRNRRVG